MTTVDQPTDKQPAESPGDHYCQQCQVSWDRCRALRLDGDPEGCCAGCTHDTSDMAGDPIPNSVPQNYAPASRELFFAVQDEQRARTEELIARLTTPDGKVVAEGPVRPAYAIAQEKLGRIVQGQLSQEDLRVELQEVPPDLIAEVMVYLGKEPIRPAAVPYPRHPWWCDKNCTWRSDGGGLIKGKEHLLLGRSWQCAHEHVVGEVPVLGWRTAEEGPEPVAATIEVYENWNDGVLEWGDEPPQLMVEVPEGPLTVQEAQALGDLLHKAAARYRTVMDVRELGERWTR